MDSKDKNQHSGKTGVYMHKVNTSEYVFNATENYTNKLIDLMKNKIVPNTEISQEAISEIKLFLQAHFVALTSKLLEADKLESKKLTDSGELSRIKSLTPKGQNIDIARSYDIRIDKSTDDKYEDNNFNLMLNFYLENLFSVSFFLSYLAIKDRQEGLEITKSSVREMQSEINELFKYKLYFIAATDPKEIIMMEIIKARNDLIFRNKKIPNMEEIAAIVRPDKHKNTLNSELKTLGLKFDYKTGIFTDRKTGEPKTIG